MAACQHVALQHMVSPVTTPATTSAGPEAEAPRDPFEHSVIEDAYALVAGCALASIGLVLMNSAGIVTAGVAGLALLLSYKLPLGVGLLFFLINLPFFVLGGRALGREFMVKSIAASALIFLITAVTHASLAISYIHPAFAALVGGTCCGMGVLMLVRHNTGVGGVNIVALWLHGSRGWSVGRMHMLLDGLILLAASAVLSVAQLGWSLLSVIATNMILVTWHRPERYLGR